ncbi:HesB/IscA family protein [Cellulosimicrobium marinum]|uniref:HesB/IscA family protein n=1 Tax=Cellulosimicrobium marinum TaxID=1638992 RepID=UPI001E301A35|nr:iron-sulfur cluster biosynthesis family protein [Cellulosimicrobium marinum]MCB7135223.1 Fe-S cluster assembly protein HesB [Cellulosimicrobium marinum]
MLTLTDNARTAVQDLTTQAGVPEGGGLRIAESTDQAGSFELALVPAPQPDDEVVENGEAKVFVEAQTVQTLSNLTLDTDPNAQGPSFVLTPQG